MKDYFKYIKRYYKMNLFLRGALNTITFKRYEKIIKKFEKEYFSSKKKNLENSVE